MANQYPLWLEAQWQESVPTRSERPLQHGPRPNTWTLASASTLLHGAIPEMNFGRLGGWLEGEARRCILRKVHAGRPLAAKTGRTTIKKWCIRPKSINIFLKSEIDFIKYQPFTA